MKLFSTFRPNKASVLIRCHLDGSGNGYELDDLVHGWVDDPNKADVIDRIMAINNFHTASGEPPLDIYKSEARAALTQLAEKLEVEGR